MKLTPHIQNILDNSKKDTEWRKEAEERKSVRQESRKSGMIATQLAYFMKTNGISQTDLGKLIGVSPQHISKILKGRENLTLGTIEKIETALKIELIKAVDLEHEQKTPHVIEGSFMKLDLGASTIGYGFNDPEYHVISERKYYGSLISSDSIPSSFSIEKNEGMQQRVSRRTRGRLKILKNKNEFSFTSEECVTPIVDSFVKSPQVKVAWVESESFISEEI